MDLPYVVNINHDTNPRLLRHHLVIELHNTFELVIIQRELQPLIITTTTARTTLHVHGDQRAIELNFPQPERRNGVGEERRRRSDGRAGSPAGLELGNPVCHGQVHGPHPLLLQVRPQHVHEQFGRFSGLAIRQVVLDRVEATAAEIRRRLVDADEEQEGQKREVEGFYDARHGVVVQYSEEFDGVVVVVVVVV